MKAYSFKNYLTPMCQMSSQKPSKARDYGVWKATIEYQGVNNLFLLGGCKMLWALKQKRGSQATTVAVFAYNCPKIMKPFFSPKNKYMIKYNNETYL